MAASNTSARPLTTSAVGGSGESHPTRRCRIHLLTIRYGGSWFRVHETVFDVGRGVGRLSTFRYGRSNKTPRMRWDRRSHGANQCPTIYVDADACPVKEEVSRVFRSHAARHQQHREPGQSHADAVGQRSATSARLHGRLPRPGDRRTPPGAPQPVPVHHPLRREAVRTGAGKAARSRVLVVTGQHEVEAADQLRDPPAGPRGCPAGVRRGVSDDPYREGG